MILDALERAPGGGKTRRRIKRVAHTVEIHRAVPAGGGLGNGAAQLVSHCRDLGFRLVRHVDRNAGQHAFRRHDREAVREPGHGARAARADAVGIGVHEQVAGREVSREARVGERARGVNTFGQLRVRVDVLHPAFRAQIARQRVLRLWRRILSAQGDAHLYKYRARVRQIAQRSLLGRKRLRRP